MRERIGSADLAGNTPVHMEPIRLDTFENLSAGSRLPDLDAELADIYKVREFEKKIASQLQTAYESYCETVDLYNTTYATQETAISTASPELVAKKIETLRDEYPSQFKYLTESIAAGQDYVMVITPANSDRLGYAPATRIRPGRDRLQLQGLPENLYVKGGETQSKDELLSDSTDRVSGRDNFHISFIEKNPVMYDGPAGGLKNYLKGLRDGAGNFLRLPDLLEFYTMCSNLSGFDASNEGYNRRYDETATVIPDKNVLVKDNGVPLDMIGMRHMAIKGEPGCILGLSVWGDVIMTGIISPNTPLRGVRLVVDIA